jgi:hypothetical protein
MARVRLFLAVALLLVTPAVFAQETPRWSYVEAGYIDFDPDAGLSDDGFFAGGSMGIFKAFHLVAEYDEVGDYTFWNAGGGWHGLLGEPADVFAEVIWNDVEVDTGSGDVSDDGYEVAAGLRWRLCKWFEAKGKASFVDFSDAGDDVVWELGGLVTFMNDKLGVGASWETGDSDTLRGFVRFNFGK